MKSNKESQNPMESKFEARLIRLSDKLEIEPQSESWYNLAYQLDQKVQPKSRRLTLSKWVWPISIAASFLIIIGLWQFSKNKQDSSSLVLEKLTDEPVYYSNYLRLSHQLVGYTPVGEGQTKKKFTAL
jgi:hypothetical protein